MATATQTGLPTPRYGDTPPRPDRILEQLIRIRYPNATGKLAQLVDWKRSTVHHHRKGRTLLDKDKIDAYAEAFDVPPEIFFCEDPADAVAWLTLHRPEWFA